MQALVTGASGLVGRNLVPLLLSRGIEVRVLISDAQKASNWEEMGCEVCVTDIQDEQSILKAATDIDIAYHLAAILRECGDRRYETVNYQGTLNLVNALKRTKGGHLVLLSYLPAEPASANRYLKSKGLAEESVRQSGLPYTIFRCSLIYGPGGELANILKILISFPIVPLPGRGETKLQPIHVADVVDCLAKVPEIPQTTNKIINLGGPTILMDKELLALSARIMGKTRIQLPIPMPLAVPLAKLGEKLLLYPGATSNEVELSRYESTCDIRPSLEIFGQPSTPLEEGLTMTLADVALLDSRRN